VNDVENWSASLVDTDKRHISVIRQADIDNHNREGGFWVVSDGCVFDISHLRSNFTLQQVEECIRECIFCHISVFNFVGHYQFILLQVS